MASRALKRLWTYVKVTKISKVAIVGKGLAATGGICLFGFTISHHIFPDKFCKERHAAKSFHHEIPTEVEDAFYEFARTLGLKNPEKVRLFYSSGLSAVSAGSTLLPNGAVIGIPRSLLFRNEKSVRYSGLTFQKEPIDWDSPQGKQLVKAFVTNDRNLLFTLGHEVSHLVSQDFVIRSVFPVFWYYIAYATIRSIGKLSRKSNKMAKIFWITLMPLCIVIIIVLFKRTLQPILHSQEFRADEMSALCSIDNCMGGIEYMTKRIEANRILRTMAVTPESSGYTETGEEEDNNTHPTRAERIKKLEFILLNHYKAVSAAKS